MKTTRMLLIGAVAMAMSIGSAVAADDFHALTVLKATPAPLQDDALASTEGGSICATPNASTSVNNGGPGGGVSLCSSLGSVTKGAFHSVSNQLPVTAANFLQVIGWVP